jgi:integrase/recombinase XerC
MGGPAGGSFSVSPGADGPESTVDALLAGYLDTLVAGGKAAHTVDSSRLDLLQLGRFLGRQGVGSVTVEDLRAFFAWLARQQGNAISSLRRKTSTVKQFFRQLQADGVVEHDPSAGLVYPTPEASDHAPLSEAELDAIVDAASSPSWRALVVCLIDAGLKRDEVVALRIEDVELPPDAPAPGRIQVRHRRATKRVRHRTLGLTERLAATLTPLVREKASRSDETVFGLSARGVDFVVETAGRRAGVRLDGKVTPRMLRDGYACARMRSFVAEEAPWLREPSRLAEARREHDRLLLRELGLSDRSAAAERYRRLVQGLEVDRSEQRRLDNDELTPSHQLQDSQQRRHDLVDGGATDVLPGDLTLGCEQGAQPTDAVGDAGARRD